MKAFAPFVASLFLIFVSLCPAAPATQPAPDRGRIAPMLESFRDAVAKLDLSDDQKTKVREILGNAGKELQTLREKAGADRGAEARGKVRQIMQDTREQISQILSPDQQQKLRELMQQGIQGRIEENKPAPKVEARKSDDGMSPKMDDGMQPMQPTEPMQPKAKGDNRLEAPKPKPPSTEPPIGSGPAAGSTAPDFKLQKLDGSTVQLSAYKGKVLVVTFGSYTCPAFRDRVAGMEELKKQAGSSVNFLTVYTKEAHPQGVWDVARNKDEEIAFPQHADAKARELMAKMSKDKLGITGPIAVDSMDDAMIKSFGGFPNGTVIIGRDGKIFARQTWTDPTGLRRLIDEAMAQRATTRPAE